MRTYPARYRSVPTAWEAQSRRQKHSVAQVLFLAKKCTGVSISTANSLRPRAKLKRTATSSALAQVQPVRSCSPSFQVQMPSVAALHTAPTSSQLKPMKSTGYKRSTPSISKGARDTSYVGAHAKSRNVIRQILTTLAHHWRLAAKVSRGKIIRTREWHHIQSHRGLTAALITRLIHSIVSSQDNRSRSLYQTM